MVPSSSTLPSIPRRIIQESYLEDMTHPVLRMGQILQKMSRRKVRYAAGGNRKSRLLYPKQLALREKKFPAHLGNIISVACFSF
jgi:hypothetical protein